MHNLFYREPAQTWTEALPLGGGNLGAMVYANPHFDRICLNDLRLWSGSPRAWNNHDAVEALNDCRNALSEGDLLTAEGASYRMQGPNTESYLPLADLLIENRGMSSEFSSYSRSLNMRTGQLNFQWSYGESDYKATAFIDRSSQVFVLRYETKDPLLHLSVGIEPRLWGSQSALRSRGIVLSGRAPEISYELEFPAPADEVRLYAPTDETALASFYEVGFEINTNGEINHSQLKLEDFGARGLVGAGFKEDEVIAKDTYIPAIELRSASYVEIRLTTLVEVPWRDPAGKVIQSMCVAEDELSNGDFLFKPASGQSKELRSRLNQKLLKSFSKSWKESYPNLLQRHQNEFSELYERCTLSLCTPNEREKAEKRDLKERILMHQGTSNDLHLEEVFFHFARYLLISGGMGELPLNLMGMWNPLRCPPWRSGYTININTEMNYWPVEVLNLPEVHDSLLDFLPSLAEHGLLTARVNYACRGWLAHHNTDIWGQTGALGEYGDGAPSAACWQFGGAWLMLSAIEHYRYSLDEQYLTTYLLPLLAGSLRFLFDWLIQDEQGTLHLAPDSSPENSFVWDGHILSVARDASGDLALLRELAVFYIAAVEYCESDLSEELSSELVNLADEARSVLERLIDFQILGDGRLAEWDKDYEEKDPHHRHLTPLIALYPGRIFSVSETPEYVLASKKLLERRGDKATGWGMAWRIALWARLQDGNRAHGILNSLLRPSFDRHGREISRAGSIYQNLFDAHPPFQIDGNLGAAAAMAEMLLRSEGNELCPCQTTYILPALPEAWVSGSVSGLLACGGLEVSIYWSEHRLNELLLRPRHSIRTSLELPSSDDKGIWLRYKFDDPVSLTKETLKLELCMESLHEELEDSMPMYFERGYIYRFSLSPSRSF